MGGNLRVSTWRKYFLVSVLTCCTLWGVHRWLCVGCRTGSPGRCESLRSGRPLPPGHSRRSAPTAETPEETWPASRRIWAQKGRRNRVKGPIRRKSWKESASHRPPEHWIQLFRDVVVSVFDFILAEPKNNVRVGLPVGISRVQVRGLQRKNISGCFWIGRRAFGLRRQILQCAFTPENWERTETT